MHSTKMTLAAIALLLLGLMLGRLTLEPPKAEAQAVSDTHFGKVPSYIYTSSEDGKTLYVWTTIHLGRFDGFAAQPLRANTSPVCVGAFRARK